MKKKKKKKCPSGGPRFLQGEEREEPPALIQVWQSQGSIPEWQALEKGHKEKWFLILLCHQQLESNLNILVLHFLKNFYLFIAKAAWILVPLTRDGTCAPAVKAQSPNDWTTREFLLNTISKEMLLIKIFTNIYSQ